MNKKIKVIELFNRMNENENIPKKIKYNDIEYTYDENMQEYYACKEGRTSYFFYNVVEHKWSWLDTEVEILEDEEEIDINDLEDLPLNYKEVSELSIDSTFIDFHNNTRAEINKIIKYLKQLDKKINKED